MWLFARQIGQIVRGIAKPFALRLEIPQQSDPVVAKGLCSPSRLQSAASSVSQVTSSHVSSRRAGTESSHAGASTGYRTPRPPSGRSVASSKASSVAVKEGYVREFGRPTVTESYSGGSTRDDQCVSGRRREKARAYLTGMEGAVWAKKKLLQRVFETHEGVGSLSRAFSSLPVVASLTQHAFSRRCLQDPPSWSRNPSESSGA